jgi:hypothetical protein
MARYLRVSRPGYYRKPYTRSDGTRVAGAHVKGSTFKVKDRGMPGRGPKTIPTRTPSQAKSKFGTEHPLNQLSARFGAKHMSFLADRNIDAFVRAGVKQFGEKEFRGMIQARINQGAKGRFATVLDKVKASLDKQFMGGGWS